MGQQVKYLLLLALLLTLLVALLITLLVADGLADLLAVIVGYLLAFLVTLGLADLHSNGQQQGTLTDIHSHVESCKLWSEERNRTQQSCTSILTI